MSKPNRFIFLLVIMLSGILIYSGCSASSNTIRYNPSGNSSNDDGSDTRYGTNEDNKPPAGGNNVSARANEIDTLDAFSNPADSDTDDIPVDSKKIDIASLLKKYGTSNKENPRSGTASTGRDKMIMEIIKYLDTPYKYGGITKNGIDCSAYTQAVYEKALDVTLGRSARDQYVEGEEIGDKSELQFGDLVFFNTRRRARPGHVGIYIGDNLFTHASSKNGVIVSSLDEAYYSRRYMGARRIKELDGAEKISGGN